MTIDYELSLIIVHENQHTKLVLVEELKRRVEIVKKQIKRLEEAKIVSQETMHIEVNI